MHINPEILRNFWLSFSIHRVVVVPLVILLLIYLSYSATDNNSNFVGLIASISIYSFIVFIWGSFSAAGSVLSQINNNTWDYQRLSSISPWTLAWGTVFGSTLFVWYCAAFSYTMIAFFAVRLYSLDIAIHLLGALLVGGLFNIVFITLVGMQSLQTSNRASRRRSAGFRILGIVVGLISFQITLPMLPLKEIMNATPTDIIYELSRNLFSLSSTANFFGLKIRYEIFLLYSVFIFMLWALFGVYRSMRTELKMRSTPWGWSVFLIFLFAYFSDWSYTGLKGNDLIFRAHAIGPIYVDNFLAISFFISLISCYVMFFSDHISVVRFRMMFHHMRHGNLKNAAEYFPRLFISLLFVIITLIGISILNPTVSSTSPNVPVSVMFLVFTLFLMRDIGILIYFSFATDNRHAFMLTLIYFVLLYHLIPQLVHQIDSSYGYVFYPVLLNNLSELAPILIQLIIVYGFIFFRWTASNPNLKRT